MIVRDVERQGYPFIEAAASALDACDELLISDGGSSDRTWEGLEALTRAFGERVKLFRDPWPGPENRLGVLRIMTNVVRRRCRSSTWCFSLQANEILSSRSAEALRRLPSQHPGVEIFRLPYLELMGPHLISRTSLRSRLFRNVPDIVAIGDAHAVDGVLPVRRVPVRTVGLPEPVYRYRAMFPQGYLEKLRSIVPREPVWDEELKLAEDALAQALDGEDPVAAFWGRMRERFCDGRWRRRSEGSGAPAGYLASVDRAPGAAEHLLWRWRYDIDDSISWLSSVAASGN